MNSQEERLLRQIIHSELIRVNSKNNLRKIVNEEIKNVLNSGMFENMLKHAVKQALYGVDSKMRIREMVSQDGSMYGQPGAPMHSLEESR